MASNDVHFSISCDNTKAQYSINNVYKSLDTLYDKSNRVGKNISKNNLDAVSVINLQYQHINKSDTVKRAGNALEAFGRQVKALRIHGLDPATNSIARFINVAGGGFFNVITMSVTAVMGLYMGLKTVNKYLQEFYSALTARADTLIKLSKNSISNLDKEKKLVQSIVDELAKLNLKEQLSNVEQVKAVSLALQLKNKWSGINVLIDQATGRIKNLNQIQAALNRLNIAKTSEELENIIEQQNTKLDLQLSKYTGKTDIFRGGVRGQNPFLSYKLFRGKRIEDITAFDLFPGLINNFDDAEAVKKIDMNRLLFGDTSQRIDFFREIASHLTNLDAFTELNEIIDTLVQKLEYLKQLNLIADPTKLMVGRIELYNKIQLKNVKAGEAINKKWELTENEIKKYNFQNAYEKLSTGDKIGAQNAILEGLKGAVEQLEAKRSALANSWLSDPDKYINGNGRVGSRKMDSIAAQNSKIAELYKEYAKIDDTFKDRTERFMTQYALYQRNVGIVENYKLRKMWNSGRTQMTDELKAAKEYVDSFAEDYFDVWWEGLTKAMKKAKDDARLKLNLTNNDANLAAQMDEAMEDLFSRQRLLVEAEALLDLIGKTYKLIMNAQTLLVKLDKQQKELWLQELNDLFDELAELVRLYEQRKKDIRSKQQFVDSFAKDVLGKYYQDNGMLMLWRRKLLLRQWKEQLGVKLLNGNQKSIVGRLAYIEQLQKAGEDQNTTFKYGVKTNLLAAKGGWNSSVYVSGKDNVMQQNLKTNQNQVKILEQINKLMPLLRKELENLNSSLKI